MLLELQRLRLQLLLLRRELLRILLLQPQLFLLRRLQLEVQFFLRLLLFLLRPLLQITLLRRLLRPAPQQRRLPHLRRARGERHRRLLLRHRGQLPRVVDRAGSARDDRLRLHVHQRLLHGGGGLLLPRDEQVEPAEREGAEDEEEAGAGAPSSAPGWYSRRLRHAWACLGWGLVKRKVIHFSFGVKTVIQNDCISRSDHNKSIPLS